MYLQILLLSILGGLAVPVLAGNLRIGEPVDTAPTAPEGRHDGMYYSLPVMPTPLGEQLPDLPDVPDAQNPPLPPNGLVIPAQRPTTPAVKTHLTEEDLRSIYDELLAESAGEPDPNATPTTTTLPPKPVVDQGDNIDQPIAAEDRLYLPTVAPKTRMERQEALAPDPQDDLKAQTELAIQQLTGKGGVPANPDMALSLLKQAAGQDYAEAQFWLGEAYSGGFGVEENANRAFSWYSQAAELGNVNAQIKLSTLYMLGKGIRFNLKKAYEWLLIAERFGSEDAAFIKQSLTGKLSAQELEDAQYTARAFKPRQPLAKMAPPAALQ